MDASTRCQLAHTKDSKYRSSPVNHELVVGFGQSEEGLKQHASLYFWLKRILWGMRRAVAMMSRWVLVRWLIS